MQTTMSRYLVLLICLYLASCAAIDKPVENLKQNELLAWQQALTVTLPEPNRPRFSGKGAGAGMMMMSSMGPMGIAIGVAIDEGIAKDIAGQLVLSGVALPESIQTAFVQYLINTSEYSAGTKVHLEIQRYGFITQRGDNDPITAEIHLRYQFDGQDPIEIKFPQTYQGDYIPTLPLAEAKLDGQASARLFSKALALVLPGSK